MIDDPTISKIFTEFLLQGHAGLLPGSSKKGMTAPKAAVLMTSNSEELPRYINYFANNCVAASTDFKLFHVFICYFCRYSIQYLYATMRFVNINCTQI